MAPSELWSQHGGGLGLHKETEKSETEGLWLVLKDTLKKIPAKYLELLHLLHLNLCDDC